MVTFGDLVISIYFLCNLKSKVLRNLRVIRSKVGASLFMNSNRPIEWNILSISFKPRVLRMVSQIYFDEVILYLTSVEYLHAFESSSKMMLKGFDEHVFSLLRGLEDSTTYFPLSALLGVIGWMKLFKKIWSNKC